MPTASHRLPPPPTASHRLPPPATAFHRLPPPGVAARLDATTLTQILLNLLQNAARHTSRGVVELSCVMQEPALPAAAARKRFKGAARAAAAAAAASTVRGSLDGGGGAERWACSSGRASPLAGPGPEEERERERERRPSAASASDDSCSERRDSFSERRARLTVRDTGCAALRPPTLARPRRLSGAAPRPRTRRGPSLLSRPDPS